MLGSRQNLSPGLDTRLRSAGLGGHSNQRAWRGSSLAPAPFENPKTMEGWRRHIPDISDVAKRKRKLTTAEKEAKKARREQYEWIFVRGKQKRVHRPPTIEGLSVDEFILRNADPLWLHQEAVGVHRPGGGRGCKRR